MADSLESLPCALDGPGAVDGVGAREKKRRYTRAVGHRVGRHYTALLQGMGYTERMRWRRIER